MKSKMLFVGLAMISLLSACLQTSLSGSEESCSSGRWVAWSAKPAERWEDAFVTGDGSHGTMVTGRPSGERITCVHEELFIRGWNHHLKTVPQTAHLLPEVRSLIEANRHNEASALMAREADRQLTEMGAFQRWPLIPHPAFDLQIDYADTLLSAGYRRQLDLETGEAQVRYDGEAGVTESVFSSRAHHVNVIRLQAGSQHKITASLALAETPGREGMHFEHNLDSAFLRVTSAAESDWLTYQALYRQDPGGYEGVARVQVTGGSHRIEGDRIQVEEADEVLIVLRITPLERGEESRIGAVKQELSRLPDTYEALLQPHAKLHQELFCRMQLDLGCAEQWQTTPTTQLLDTIEQRGVTPLFLEQMHAMGRYLLISSCGKYAPPLQGIWGGGWKPMWIGGFVWDSNINLAISAASLCNLPECAESYCHYVEGLLPGWRLNAERYLGCRGFLVAHYNDPENGYLTHFGPAYPWMCWAGGAGWNLRPFYEYALMTGDDTMMEQRIFPLYREMALFYDDFLVMGVDSLYHITPSISPENTPNGNNTWLSRDATMDVAIAREVYTLLGQMGTRFGATPEELAHWDFCLSHLPDYRINSDGALAEWVDPAYPDVYAHRHLSHLYPVFPGTQLSKRTGQADLVQAARVALDKRYAFDTSSAHGLIHLALQAARLGDVEKVANNLERFSHRQYVYEGLATSHDPYHSIYNLDASLSLPRLFMEMLYYTEPGELELMPAWPEGFPDGTLKGVRLAGGHTMDLTWRTGAPVEVVIHAARTEHLTVHCQGQQTAMDLQAGQTAHLRFSGCPPQQGSSQAHPAPFR